MATVELHVEEYGAGEPTVVLLHGFGGSARNFRPQARYLKSRCRVVLFDARGHARSAAPEDPTALDIDAHVEDVQRLLRERGSARVVLGGLSMGAAIALRFALTHPDDPALCGLVLASYPAPGDASPTSWALRFADAIEQQGLDAAGAQFVWGGGRFDAEAARFIQQGFREHRPAALAATLRRVLAVLPRVDDLAADIARLHVPALVIAGERDAASLAPSREIARLAPRAELAVIPGAGHVVNLEKAELFNELLGDFLSRIEG